MAVAAQERTSPWTSVLCSECGSDFPLALRNVTRLRSQGREPVCPTCRCPRPKPTQADYDFWLSRMSMEEIRQLGEAIWT